MPPCLFEEESELTFGLPHPLGQAVRALAHEERDAVAAFAASVRQRSRLESGKVTAQEENKESAQHTHGLNPCRQTTKRREKRQQCYSVH